MTDQTIPQDNLVEQKPVKKVNGISIENLPDLLTVAEVADLLRVSKLTIKRWGKRGKLPAIRINARGDRRYRKEAVLWLLGIQQGE
jgi:excisionase family DNA binding protein